jgi:drug/metabolite transporter (DMT)-like permease
MIPAAPGQVASRLLPFAVLIGLGAAWGLATPMTKVMVSAGYRDVGIVFWQAVIDLVVLLPVLARFGGLPRHRAAWLLYLFVAFFGSILPGVASTTAARFLPSGVVSLCISLVPLFALPIALMLGTDRASPARLLGLVSGLGGVALILWPGSIGALTEGQGLGMAAALAMIAPLSYAIEGNAVARLAQTRLGADVLAPGLLGAAQMVAGASLISALLAGPLALMRGVFLSPFDLPLLPGGNPLAPLALVASALISLAAYVGYLWLIGRAGAVFAAQVSYLVTGFGIFWAMVLLGERFAPGFWGAMAVIFFGLILVQPRNAAAATQVKTTGTLVAEPGADNMGSTH